MTMSDPLSPAALSGALPYGFMTRWRQLGYPEFDPLLMGGQDNDEDSDNEDEENAEDDANGSSDEEDSEAKRINALTEEAKRHRLRAKRYRQSAERGESIVAILAKRFGKEPNDITTESLESLLQTNPDADEKANDLARDNSKLVGEVERLNTELNRRDVDDAIRDAAMNAGFRPQRVPSVLKLIDRDDFEIEDGNVEGLSDAIEKMVKDYPEWLSDDGDKSDNGEKPPPAKATNKRRKTQELDVEYLRNKYPSLRR